MIDMQEAFYMQQMSRLDPYSSYVVTHNVQNNRLTRHKVKNILYPKVFWKRMFSGFFLIGTIGALFVVLGAKYIGDAYIDKENRSLEFYLCAASMIVGAIMVLGSIVVCSSCICKNLWNCKCKKKVNAESDTASNQNRASNVSTDARREEDAPPPYDMRVIVVPSGNVTSYNYPTLVTNAEPGLVLPPVYSEISQEPPQYSLVDQSKEDTEKTDNMQNNVGENRNRSGTE